MKYIVTTAIDYTNDVIHLGHVYQKVLADYAVRTIRRNLGNESVRFVTGTDEFGLKVYKKALSLNKNPKEYVDMISKEDQKEYDLLQISYDRYIRTTDEDHQKVAQDFFQKSYENGYIYESTFESKYCEGCEEYKTETSLENGKCPFHPNLEISLVSEKNFFFKQSAFRERLKEYFIQNQNFVSPKGRYNEMFEMIDKLEDIPVTRKKENVPWGIECPLDEEQVLYVWFDALINYYTFAGHDWNQSNQIIHFLGKDNSKFHALLWPCMLMSVGINPPTHIYSHGFMSLKGQKISKSLGNIVKASDLIQEFSSDVLRYYLLKFGPILDDADFSQSQIKEIYNGELANGFGNTISRVFTLAKKHGTEFQTPEKILDSTYTFDISTFRPDKDLESINERVSIINKEINEKEPWKISDNHQLQILLNKWLTEIFHITDDLTPVMPQTCERIFVSFRNNFQETNFFPRR